MAFRDPLYLDTDLLRNLADHYGVALATEGEVVRKLVEERSGKAGVNKVVEVGRQSGLTEEVTETYMSAIRPVRALNDVIDRLLEDAGTVDLTATADADLTARQPLQAEGDLMLSTATEVGGLVARFLPLLAAQGATATGDLSEADIAALLLAPPSTEHTHVYEMRDDIGRTLVVLARPDLVYGGADLEDLEGDRTVFGVIDRLVADGNSFSLERYVLPGLNRTLRRALSGDKLIEMLQSFGELSGQQLSEDALRIDGPAAIISPLAIY